MTKNTGLYKVQSNGITVTYRDLTVEELEFLSKIKKADNKNELAAKTSIIEPTDLTKIPWPILQQIGQNALTNSTKWVNDKQLFEILVKEYREDIKEGNGPLIMIKQIMQVFPGQSVTDLLKLTWKDPVELTCLAESVVGKKIFDVAGGMPTIPKKGTKLINPQAFEEDGTSLQDKMNALNASLGGIPK